VDYGQVYTAGNTLTGGRAVSRIVEITGVCTRALLTALLACTCTALAQSVPLQVHYQGYLTSNTGVPVNAPTSITFRLYDTQGASTALWTETQTSVPVSNGSFRVMLGSQTPLAVAVFDTARWLGVQAAADAEMTPRQMLGSAPFALRAGRADALSGSATVQGSQITGVITGATIAGAVPWVIADESNQLAASNTAYLATGASAVVVTLPAAAAVGAIVKVSSPGTGGFSVVPNAGQTVVGNDSAAVGWMPRESARNWHSIASSADGTKLVAVAYGGQIYTSTDSGATWTPRESDRAWYQAALSAVGTKMVAVVSGGQIYTSTDSGVTWTARDTTRSWYSVASSADGTKLVAGTNGGQIYTSTDSGVSWTPRDSARSWISVASSADGTKLAAVVYGGQIYMSTDSGVTWAPRDSVRNWTSVASSADGTKLAAVVQNGQIYTSTSSGISWTARESVRNWATVAASPTDGTRLVAAVYGGQIYTSIDSGVSWIPQEAARNWQSVASSADGAKLVAAPSDGPIYSNSRMTIAGGRYAQVELVYAGDGQWVVTYQRTP